MKNALISIIISIILNLGFFGIFAQEVILTSGNTSTAGQVTYAENNESSTSLNKEEKHTLEFSVVSSLDEAKTVDLIQINSSIENYFTLIFTTNEKQLDTAFSYQVYDMNGKLWLNKNIYNQKTKISMEHLPSASYYIMVFKNDKAVKIFKVSKKSNI